MNASEIMTHRVYSCTEEASASDAAELMWNHDIGCVPIVDWRGRAVGVVTDRDICMAAYLQGSRLTDIPVTAISHKQVVAAREDDDLVKVESLMQRHQIRRIPVLDGGGCPIGMVSLNDIAQRNGKGVDASSLARTLSAIGEPPAADGIH